MMVSLIFMQFESKIKILDYFLFLTRYFKCTFLNELTLRLLKYREKLSGKLLQILRYK